ncbi:AAA family ATPase [Hamadaea sp. NPDC050747]|uniref:helix-turn-helix transcriptional regulator n=1 Tax=Hamadaea sp. NPDC050747 TaxID=3155789 RepID=UPI0033EACBA1
MVSPVLVGRTDQATAIRAAYELVCAARPVTVLVSGEAGIGKSRLVAAAVSELPSDPLVLTGHCLELGSDGAPYVPFVAIIRQLLRRLGVPEVRRLLPSGSPALSDWLAELGPAPDRYAPARLLEEVLTVVVGCARQRPVVLVVEDLHWADAASRELFAYLARNLADTPVLLIGTMRTGAESAGPSRVLFAEIGRRAEVVRVALEPLDERAVGSMLEAIDGTPADAARARRIHRRSGGNPLFIEALSNSGEVPADDLHALLSDRISTLPAPARNVLDLLAVAGDEVDDRLLTGLSGLTEPDLRTALGYLVDAGLVAATDTAYAIRHDLIRETVYATMLPAERRRRHERYATALAARNGDDLTLAAHWLAAGEPDQAVPVAWHAADRAGRQHAYDEQLHLLELVLAHWHPDLLDVERATVLETAAAAAFAAGQSIAGVAHCTAALAEIDQAADPLRTARLLGLRGQAQARIDSTGSEDLRRAVDLVPPGTADALRSRLLSTLAFVGAGAYQLDSTRRAAREAWDIAERLDDDALRAPALLVLAAVDGQDGHRERGHAEFARSRAAAERVGAEHVFLTTFQWEALLAGQAGDYERAVSLAATGQRLAEQLGHVRSRGSMLAAARASFLTLLGRWDEALAVVDDALADEPPPLYTATLRIVAARIARWRGEFDRFEVLLRQLTTWSRQITWGTEIKTDIFVLRIGWALDRGDPDEADRVLDEALATRSRAWFQSDLRRMVHIGAEVQRARRAAAPRNKVVAQQTEARLVMLADLLDTITGESPALTAYRLALAACRSGKLGDYDQAATAWRELHNPYETATALLDAAGAALATNNKPGARSRLREARALAEQLQAAPLLARIEDLVVRGRLDSGTPKAPNDFGLTARELDVLRVLARGRTNAQIASELFITPNTVATHIARILTKLGAASRTEATVLAHESGLL